MTELIRVLVADDHMVVREGLRALLIPRNGMEVVGEAVDGADAVEKARALQPDVILMDLNMPVKSGLEATAEIIRENPEARILVLTSFGEEANLSTAIQAGALGYLLKNTPAVQLFHTIRGVAMGNLTLGPEVARMIKQNLRPSADRSPSPIPNLTERELDVLRGVARGQSNEEIANALSIEKSTVRSHVSTILTKLELDNRTQAALYAIEMGLAKLGSDAASTYYKRSVNLWAS